ncbi:MAG: TolC family protein [Bryobacteraceae bacterium]|jgi:cobalt-zinc-cadmium efflux system outer membrane protein
MVKLPNVRLMAAVLVLVVAALLLLAASTDPRPGKIAAPWWLRSALLALVAMTGAALYAGAWRRPRRSPLRVIGRLGLAILLGACLLQSARAQSPYTWQQIRDRFEAANPTLQAARIGIDESRADEITAFLRPNPTVTATIDQIDPFSGNPYRPFANALPYFSASYLLERQHKRELRRASAQGATAIAQSQLADQERTLLFSLRTAFVQALQAKAILALANENLGYYDRVLGVSRDRFKAGDIAGVDLDRLELQRVQYESDVQTAEVNVRTAKIQLLTLLNDRTPVEQFDVTGPFDFTDQVLLLDEFRKTALEARPDLKAALQSIDKAKTDHQLSVANGSTDPTFSLDLARNPPIPVYFGISVSIPLRIFDRNQGDKLHTQLDIGRNERLRTAAEAQVFSDVDSAYATLNSNLALLRPYKAQYLQQAVRIRDTITFSYQRGGASLLDFLQAQQDYRGVQVSYLNLVGAYLSAASQLNLAVGREVIQ